MSYDPSNQPPLSTPELAMVIHIVERQAQQDKLRSKEAALEETLGLAQALFLNVRHHQIIQIQRPHPATLIGKGNVEHLKTIVSFEKITLAIIDCQLTPVQQRNLEKILKCKVIDRTGLILEIFAKRARTAEGRLQVDLALLRHQRSQLVRAWTHLERQRGGGGFIGGPGERQIELDRRLIDNKILKLEKDLEQVKRTRALHRKNRTKSDMPVIALVGYTNAGKSTLFNYLTQAHVLAENMLFATLDPTLRPIKLLNGRTVLLSDTVGFISDLPTQLVAAFRATLEEVCSASVILHVRDASHPDHEAQKNDVYNVLDQLQVDYDTQFAKPTLIEVFNKIDLLEESEKQQLINTTDRKAQTVAISAKAGEGLHKLFEAIQQALSLEGQVYKLILPFEAGDILAWCYRRGFITHREDTDEGIVLTLHLSELSYYEVLDRVPKGTLIGGTKDQSQYENVEVLRKRLIYQCQYRGTRELSWIFQRVAHHIDKLSDRQLLEMKDFLNENEHTLTDWLLYNKMPPESYQPLIHWIKQFYC